MSLTKSFVKKAPLLRNPEKELVIYWFIHHEIIIEAFTYPVHDRINSIRYTKAMHQRKSRLEAMKPVLRPDLLPEGVRRMLKKAWKLGRYSSADIISNYFARRPDMLAKVRRRLFKEYPKCPCSHDHPEKSFLVFSESARQRARTTNRKMFSK